MAITRAQQAKQMLQDGGRIGFKQGQGTQGQSRRGGAPGGRRAGPGTGSGGGKDRDKGSDFGQFDRAVKRAKENPGITTGGGDGSSILDFVPGIGTVRRIASVFGPLDNREFFQQKVVPAGRTNLNFDDYMKARQAGLIDAYGNPIDQDNDNNNNIIPPQTMMAETMFQAPSNMDQETTTEDDGLKLRFRAEGGPIGGEYDFESARQMYGLGKLVKKVTRTVKKIAKSPIGKAALIGGGLGLAGIGPFKGLASTPFGSSLSNFFGKGSFNPLKAISTVTGQAGPRIMTNISPFGKLIGAIPGGGVTAAIAGTSLLAG